MSRLYKPQVHPPGSPSPEEWECEGTASRGRKANLLKWKEKMCPSLASPPQGGYNLARCVRGDTGNKWERDAIRVGPGRTFWSAEPGKQ